MTHDFRKLAAHAEDCDLCTTTHAMCHAGAAAKQADLEKMPRPPTDWRAFYEQQRLDEARGK